MLCVWNGVTQKVFLRERVIEMRVGSFIYDSCQGLGVLAHSFYQAGIISQVMVVANRRPPHFSYPGVKRVGTGDIRDILRFCEGLDVLLGFETFFWWEVIEHCRKNGVKTVLMPMYECLPPKSQLPYQPGQFLCPSLLDLDYFPDNSVYLPVPVSGVKWKRRDRARVFVHNAGNLGLMGRNGTAELVQALQYITSPAQIIIRSQKPLSRELHEEIARQSSRVDVHYSCGDYPHEKLYDYGDVFLFPEKFNGLSLPLQEALGSGMLVMASARYPNTTYLPTEPLIPVGSYRRNRVSQRCVEFDEAVIAPKAIAECVDAWYDCSIGDFSDRGLQYARENSWDVLKPRYMRALRGEVG